MVVQPSELEATVTIVEQQKMVPSKSIRKVEHFQDKSFGVKFTPQMEGRGTVEVFISSAIVLTIQDQV